METSEKPYGLSYLSLCLVLLSFIVSLAYRAFYNLYRHPLAHIPGPKLAASTYLYQTYFSLVGGSRYYIQIAEMHRKYGRRGLQSVSIGSSAHAGPVVRITPDEVHLSNPNNFEVMNCVGTKYAKSTQFYDGFGIGYSTFSTGPIDIHRIRRGMLDPFLSQTVLVVKSEMDAGRKVEKPSIFEVLLTPTAENPTPPTPDQIKDEAYSILAAAADATGGVMTVAAYYALSLSRVRLSTAIHYPLAHSCPCHHGSCIETKLTFPILINLIHPTRWLNPKNVRHIDQAFMPFCKGTQGCVGINLAYCELYLSLGTVFRRFEKLEGKRFDEGGFGV